MKPHILLSTLRFAEYRRKSTDSEDRQVLSIESQASENDATRAAHGLAVTRVFEESRSAMRPGRLIFGDMLKQIENGNLNGILAWKLNRIARNATDAGRIIQAMDDGFLKAVVTSEGVYCGTGSDKFIMMVELTVAKKYSDDLSEDVRSKTRKALEKGFWPAYPKLGYVRARDAEGDKTKDLIPDPERFPILRVLINRILAGQPPVEVWQKARNHYRLTTRKHGRNGGRLISRAGFYNLLGDKFYTGTMFWNNEEFRGNHKPLLTPAEHQEIRKILTGRRTSVDAKPGKLFFPYRGCVRCGSCGAPLTAKITTNRDGRVYRHYYCYRKRAPWTPCPEGAVREEIIDDAVRAFVEMMIPPAHWMAEALACARRAENGELKTEEYVAEGAMRELGKVESRLAKLRELLLDGVITPEDYKNDKKRWEAEAIQLKNRVEGNSTLRVLEPLETARATLNRAKYLLQRNDPSEKREIIRALMLEPTVAAKKVLIRAKLPFSLFLDQARPFDVLGWLDYVRTLPPKNN